MVLVQGNKSASRGERISRVPRRFARFRETGARRARDLFTERAVLRMVQPVHDLSGLSGWVPSVSRVLRDTGGWILVCVLWGMAGCTGPHLDQGERCVPGSLLANCRMACGSDGDCLAPARCDRYSQRCQAPLISCDPLEARSDGPGDGGDKQTDGGVRKEGGCAIDQDCDLITSTCQARTGARCAQDGDCRTGDVCAGSICATPTPLLSCQRDAACRPGQVCRLTIVGGQIWSICAPGLGATPGGGACRQSTECQSGICLRTGSCFAACTPATERTDCGGKEGTFCGKVGVVYDPRLPASLLDSCVTPGVACSSNRDCDPLGMTCQPLVNARDPARLRTSCQLAQGLGRPGGPCTQHRDCSSGLCVRSFCFAGCKTGADCRAGLACRPSSVVADGVQDTVMSCVPARPCSSPAGCGVPIGEETCAPQVTAQGDGLELVCTPGKGSGPGAACITSKDCMSGQCGEQRICLGGCSQDSDCPLGPAPLRRQEICRPLHITLDGRAGVLRVCQVPKTPCERDADCSALGLGCRPLPSVDDPTRIAPACDPVPNPSKRAGGVGCTVNSDCQSNLCVTTTNPSVCYGVCKVDEDCPAGRRCYGSSVWFLTSGSAEEPSATYDATAACLPDVGSGRACAGDGAAADCPMGEVCSYVPDAQKLALLKRCRKPQGLQANGSRCGSDADCQSGRCQATTLSADKRCAAPCPTSGPHPSGCTAGTTCQTSTLELRKGRSTSAPTCR